MNSTSLKVLAIDYGTQRIGLALSYGTLADPLTIIASDQQAVSYICKVINDYKITHVVIGISENEMARKTQEFGSLLKRVVKVPIEYFDETLSSKTVHLKLAAQKKSQQHIDHLAAAEFLQEWLETKGAKILRDGYKI